MKSSMYSVTQNDAPESTMACDVSFVHASVAISTAILRSSLFCKFHRFLVRQKLRHVDTYVECWVV
jgi:hypothetical protein